MAASVSRRDGSSSSALVGLLAQVVVDDLAPSGPAGQIEVDGAVEPARSQQGRVEVGGAVGGSDDQDVGRHVGGLAQPAVGRQPGVDDVDEQTLHPEGERGLVEGLQLDEQFVDHPGDALALARAVAPGAADGVDLLDEADGPTLASGVAPQGLEVGPDLAVGLAVEHRLEGRRRDEQERHAGLGGHGLGHVGLARAGRPLEEDGLAGRPAHLLGEGAVGRGTG